jgi:ribosomal protein S27AE
MAVMKTFKVDDNKTLKSKNRAGQSFRMAAQELEINSLREALRQGRTQVEAEQGQINSPDWQAGLYQEYHSRACGLCLNNCLLASHAVPRIVCRSV